MEKPEQPHSFSKKIYSFRNIEGEPNKQAIEAYRSLQEKLEKYPWFVGLAPLGSVARGYNIEGSDIDAKIFFDSSKFKHGDFSDSSLFPSEVVEVLKDEVSEIEKALRLKPGFFRPSILSDVNIDRFKQGLEQLRGAKYMNSLITMKDLSDIIIGSKVDKYREEFKKIFRSLDHFQKDNILNTLFEVCIEEEKTTEHKIFHRTGMSDSEWSQILEDRKKLWKKRLNTLWP